MEDQLRILEIINKNTSVSQKKIADQSGISIGKANYLIQELVSEKLIYSQKTGRNMSYFLTERGIEFLQKGIETFQEKKVKIHHGTSTKHIKQAVILAAGQRKDFDRPAGLLEINGKQLIKRNMEILQSNGINQFIIVSGYQKAAFRDLEGMTNIHLVENQRYKWTGSMASLAAAKEYIKDDFLLIEDDVLIEERAIKDLLIHQERDCILITNESGSGDEAFVEIRNGYLYKLSKDIHHFNRIDGEMIGVSKISLSVFEKMVGIYEGNNQNPYMNYEYMLMDIGRNYNIGYLKLNNIVWAEVDSLEQYERVTKKIHPILKRKEAEYRDNQIKDHLIVALNINRESIHEIQPFGGMTNKNFKVRINGQEYVLRIPGAGTEKMINRQDEKFNSLIASKIGIDTELLFFNEKSGMKVSKLIPDAETLNSRTAKREDNLKMITTVLKKLHESKERMASTFDVFEKIREYELLLIEANGNTYSGFDQVKKQVIELKEKYLALGIQLVPCHNDMVPENIIKSGEKTLFLIDWEYSGMNDPMWDLAALSLEGEFTDQDEELLLNYYFGMGKIPEVMRVRILINKIFQDFLWTIWTNIKEAKGEDFGTYGLDRFNRAKENLSILFLKEKIYELKK